MTHGSRKRVSEGLRVLRSVRARDRPALLGYLALNLVERSTGLSFHARTRTIHLEDGSRVAYQTFSSQLGPYVEILLDGIYDRCPGFDATPGQTVFDLGANIGFYTLKHARAVGPRGHVYAFEPNPRTFQLLLRNVRDNGLHWVTCLPYAVSSKSRETVTLWSSPRWTSTASLFPDTKRTGTEGVAVETISLDDFVAEAGIGRIDILKIDTEGAEALVVEGGLRRALPMARRVVMESHRTREKVRELLEPLGFKMVLDDRAHHVVFFTQE